ncbi:hypothetical protein FKW77_008854 [Venturia effusa]|uniref:Mid2 domain-containing protein n=1 Tax=Venturia effusa TaxID=50376 RepID=A0A517L9V0_9PEZI|nr:hypothetical protein FKW77_008854 [Venturia effusa]
MDQLTLSIIFFALLFSQIVLAETTDSSSWSIEWLPLSTTSDPNAAADIEPTSTVTSTHTNRITLTKTRTTVSNPASSSVLTTLSSSEPETFTIHLFTEDPSSVSTAVTGSTMVGGALTPEEETQSSSSFTTTLLTLSSFNSSPYTPVPTSLILSSSILSTSSRPDLVTTSISSSQTTASNTLIAQTSPPSNINTSHDSASLKTPIIIGIALGVSGGIVILGILGWFLYRRKKTQMNKINEDISPRTPDPTTSHEKRDVGTGGIAERDGKALEGPIIAELPSSYTGDAKRREGVYEIGG